MWSAVVLKRGSELPAASAALLSAGLNVHFISDLERLLKVTAQVMPPKCISLAFGRVTRVSFATY
jgi:hypothetical protein